MPGKAGMLWDSLAADVLRLAGPMDPYENLAATVRSASSMEAKHFSQKGGSIGCLRSYVCDCTANFAIITLNKHWISAAGWQMLLPRGPALGTSAL